MDFLTLFLIYLCFVLTAIALLCICTGRKESCLARSINGASQVLSFVIPTRLQRVTQKALHRLFHTRSCLFVVLHVALQAAVYGEYTWEVFVYCWELQFHLLLLLLPYLLLAGNMGCFILCSQANPGIITKSNHASLVKIYVYDGVLFQKGIVCPTCNMEKPARSKHCSFCSICVHRFDHHCVWVNNCIGAFNAKYFFLYLFTLTAMAATVAIITAAFLIQVVLLSNMMHGSYIDDQGQERAVEILFLIQTTNVSALDSYKGILVRKCLLMFEQYHYHSPVLEFNSEKSCFNCIMSAKPEVVPDCSLFIWQFVFR
ncbi:palmitoyltransferase ZDHHC4 isoform X2 [Buteo buteo]|uniref:palmitoyltransferase ZDHHC4 isoform X2 n=1 Tax=Buteo buteo TaxID=30397 RepID=UPI003EBADA87